ncbi:MAG: cytochrome c oxidase subunit II [Acidobacteriales bacterium]|nr:cytochrome c oxidase subunit II [Terriglobales bacterium]
MLSKYIPLWPEQASTVAGHMDLLYVFLVLNTIFFTVLVAVMVVAFSIKFRKSKHPVAVQIEGSVPLEIFWSAVPLGIAMVIFVWAAVLYFHLMRAPRESMEVYITGKQWMWKMQHPTGQREINQLHVPVNTNVRLTMISQDVIHSFFVPEFRIKHDVLPGRYTYAWFNATKPGTYHIFCTEYCGTKHSGMIGEVIVMEPAAYQLWLSGSTGGSLAQEGERQFASLGCVTCHSGQPGARGPNLEGVFGSNVKISDGRSVTADENYVRESILNPQAKIVAGYGPIMPTFAGQISEETLIQLVAFVKSKQGTGAKAGGQATPGGKQ